MIFALNIWCRRLSIVVATVNLAFLWIPVKNIRYLKVYFLTAILFLIEYCDNYMQIKYILNFLADKVCVKDLPNPLSKKLVSVKVYLDNLRNEPF